MKFLMNSVHIHCFDIISKSEGFSGTFSGRPSVFYAQIGKNPIVIQYHSIHHFQSILNHDPIVFSYPVPNQVLPRKDSCCFLFLFSRFPHIIDPFQCFSLIIRADRSSVISSVSFQYGT